MRILIIGSNSILGQVISLYYVEKGHEVYGIDKKNQILATEKFYELDVNPMNLDKIRKIINKGYFDAIINCLALLIKDSENNPERARFINAEFPHYLETLTYMTKTIVVHRSTDCIFSGKKGNYTVEDIPDETSQYAITKSEGELRNAKDVTLRTSLIGPDLDINGTSLFNWFINQVGNVNGYANSIWTGITTLEFAKIALSLIEKKAYGLFQCVPNHSVSKYRLLNLFEKHFPNNRVVIKIDNDFSDKSLVYYMGKYDLKIPNYEDQIIEMKGFIVNQNKKRGIYSHYLGGNR
jgi:dTDP-4-dehydrorhamnose reductase